MDRRKQLYARGQVWPEEIGQAEEVWTSIFDVVQTDDAGNKQTFNSCGDQGRGIANIALMG